jgi:hypothetical protein
MRHLIATGIWVFMGKPIPRPDRFLSRDGKLLCWTRVQPHVFRTGNSGPVTLQAREVSRGELPRRAV